MECRKNPGRKEPGNGRGRKPSGPMMSDLSFGERKEIGEALLDAWKEQRRALERIEQERNGRRIGELEEKAERQDDAMTLVCWFFLPLAFAVALAALAMAIFAACAAAA